LLGSESKYKGDKTMYEKTMSKKDYLKKGLRVLGTGAKKMADYIVPPKTPEQIAFENELSIKTAAAKRTAYLKSAIAESKKKGSEMAKTKYNPTTKKGMRDKDQQIMDNLMKL